MWRKIGIEPGEERVFAWGAAALFLVGWADVFVKNLSETLFVKRVGVEDLPKAFLISSLLLVLSTGLFARLAARSDRLRLLPRTMGVLAVLLVPLWFLLPRAETLVPWVLIVSSKQITSVTLLVFWIAMGDLLHARQAKRLFGPMMAGVTLGMTLGSEASRQVGSLFGVESLLPVAAFTMGLGGLATLPLRRFRPRLGSAAHPIASHVSRTQPGEEPALRRVWRDSSLFRLLFFIALGSGLVGPMLYMQFQYVADAGNPGEEGFLEFISLVRAWLGGVTLVAQIFLVSWLYRRIGIPLSIALSPALYLMSFVGLNARLTPAVGSVAMVGTKLGDNAVYDPAVRVIYNLLPEEIRARGSALVEGPVKRLGGAAGNLINWFAFEIGSARWIGFIALPIAGVWLLAALRLWRQYPGLLLSASASREGVQELLRDSALLDVTTLRALAPEVTGGNPERARVALELLGEAAPDRAVPVLAMTLERAPETVRPQIIAALDRLLENAIVHPVRSPAAARRIQGVLEEGQGLSELEAADLLQAYGRLMPGESGVPILDRYLGDPRPAVSLAARAGLTRRGRQPPGSPTMDQALEDALDGESRTSRRTAREELRALLLCEEQDASWTHRLEVLAGVLDDPVARADGAEALAEVAAARGPAAAAVRERVLAIREDPDRRVRAALLGYAGHVGLLEQAGWIVEHVGSEHAEWDQAAREALRALGPMSSDTLLRELSYGGRSKRNGILDIIRELAVEPETLRALYEREVDAMERDLVHVYTLRDRHAFALLRQRLEERVVEKLHTALLFLAAIRREDSIAELGERLRDPNARGRRHAIVLEALEATLQTEEKLRLIPFLEEGDILTKAATFARDVEVPSFEETLLELEKDPDELTRQLTAGLAVAAGFEVEDHEGVDVVEKMVHLRALPIFEGLTARQLMNLARVVKEQTLPGNTVVVEQGDSDDRLFLVVEGVIQIFRGETLLAENGPGDFFGEIALFEGIARTATARSQGTARLLVLDRPDLLALIEEMPSIAVTLLRTLSARVRELTDRLTV